MKRSPSVVASLLVGVAALAALAFYGARILLAPPAEEGEEYEEEELEPDVPLEGDERFEKVRAASREVFETFPGRITAEGRVIVRAPQGMRVAVVKIEKDEGDYVEKGDVLLRFDRPQIDRAIEKAERDGDKAAAERFRGYLEYVDLRSPVDGQVLEVWTELGRVPTDEFEGGGGLGLMTLADRSSYTLRVQVPSALLSTHANIGAKLTADLEGTFGKVTGTVAEHEAAPEGWAMLVVGLEAREGLEQDMVANLRVPTSKTEVALVPKAAVTDRGGVKIVRVWEQEGKSGSVVERTILVDGEQDGCWVAIQGVFPGDNVVVGGRRSGL